MLQFTGHNVTIYGGRDIIDNQRLSFVKVPPIIDDDMITDSHPYVMRKCKETWGKHEVH